MHRDLSSMFFNLVNLRLVDLGKLDTKYVKDMHYMFTYDYDLMSVNF
jgi:hypothetical protein